MRKSFAGVSLPRHQRVVPRPKLPPHLVALKESFSAPAFIVRAAREASGDPGKFSAWVTEALRQKLERENPTLIAKYRGGAAAEPSATLENEAAAQWNAKQSAQIKPKPGVREGADTHTGRPLKEPEKRKARA